MKYLKKTDRFRHKRKIQRLIKLRKKSAIKIKRGLKKLIKTVKYKAPEIVNVKIPKVLYLAQKSTHSSLSCVISSIQAALELGSRVRLNFDDTDTLHPCGTLMFLAYIERLLDKYPGMITSNYPKNEVVEQLFQSVKLLEKLGNTPRRKITAENVRYWDYVTGVCTDLTEMVNLFKKYESEINAELRSGLFDSVSEAICNTINHAYPEHILNDPMSEKKWWMFAQQHNSNLEIVVYDLGVGIPNSLRSKPELKEWLISRITKHRKKDSYLLSVAIESPRTVTRLPYRGKGLPEMLQFAQGRGVGGFIIYSQRGQYGYDAAKKMHIVNDLTSLVKGTLLRWSIPLDV